VDILEFRVRTEAAARQIDGCELLAEEDLRAVNAGWVKDDNRGGRANGPKGPLGRRTAR
jgi:hypothetical protein